MKCKWTNANNFWLTWLGKSNHEDIAVFDLKVLQTVDVLRRQLLGVIHWEHSALVGEKFVPQKLVLLLGHIRL